jgi:hypothetical protein
MTIIIVDTMKRYSSRRDKKSQRSTSLPLSHPEMEKESPVIFPEALLIHDPYAPDTFEEGLYFIQFEGGYNLQFRTADGQLY